MSKRILEAARSQMQEEADEEEQKLPQANASRSVR